MDPSERRLFLRVKPGHEEDLRTALRSPHEARFMLFDGLDGCMQVLFSTSFDRPWDAGAEGFDSILQHVEGYEDLGPS
jgi:hypothetical protein